jgi:hypothetical protein
MNGVSLSSKVLSFAKDKNDFFCTHELGAFYNGDDFSKLSAIVGKLKQVGKLTMTDVQEPCKMQSKRHHFYIYNKRQNEEKPKIDENGNDNFKPKISKSGKDLDFFNKAKEAILKQTTEFCKHTIAKEMGKSPKELESYLRILKEKRKLKYIGKKQCGEGERTHKFYIVVNKNLNNVKIIHKRQMQKSKGEYTKWKDKIPEIKKMISEGKTDKEIGEFYGRTRKAIENIKHRYGLKRMNKTMAKPIEKAQSKSEGDLGIFIRCPMCDLEYLKARDTVMKDGFAQCPRCKQKIVIGA